MGIRTRRRRRTRSRTRHRTRTQTHRHTRTPFIRRRRRSRQRPLQTGGQRDPAWVRCESEGCAFYPSLRDGSFHAVTKLYYADRFYDEEKRAYDRMSEVDPSFQYHGRLLSFGILSPEQWRERSGAMSLSRIRPDRPYPYLEMEYAGVPIGLVNERGENTPAFQGKFMAFLTGVLSLRTDNGAFLIHGDPHPQNVCYRLGTNPATEVKITYIDLTNLREVVPTTKWHTGTDMARHLYSLLGCARIVFGFSNRLTEQWNQLLLNATERNYEDIVRQLLTYLNEHHIGNDVYPATPTPTGKRPIPYEDVSPVSSFAFSPSPPAFMSPPAPLKKKRTKRMYDSDEEDNRPYNMYSAFSP